MSETPLPRRIVLIGYGPVGARFIEELLPAIASGDVSLTVVGAESDDAYNRVLIAEFAVGSTDRESLEITDTAAAEAAGVRFIRGTCATIINRTRHSVTLGTGAEVAYDRLVLATGARANVPTLDGVPRLHRDRMRPPTDAATLDSAGSALPRGVTALRDLDDARRVLAAVTAGSRIVVLGAGVLGMEIALAAARAGAETCVVYHGESPMARNLDVGGGTVLARSARRAGVSMVNHSRAESVVFHLDDDGVERFDALVCADGKQIFGDLLLLSCGVGARTELAALAGLAVSSGILVDSTLASHTDPDIFAIGDCAHVANRALDGAAAGIAVGAPSGLIGPGWRQADWLAASFRDEATADATPYAERSMSVVMLKAEGLDVVAAGNTTADLWDLDSDHAPGCGELSIAQWADPEHGRYVKMVTRAGVLEGFVSVGMPRTGAELTMLFERGSELPADRSVLLRFDGPDYVASAANGAFSPGSTVCWCNGVTVEAITVSAGEGNTTVACIGADTRAGTGCGGCKGRIGDVLERVALT